MLKSYPDHRIRRNLFGAVDYDMGELAARLDSPCSLRRSGRVVYLTSFEESGALNAWNPCVDATLVNNAYRGAQALRLGNGAVTYSYVRKTLPLMPNQIIGIEFMFWYHEVNAFHVYLAFPGAGAGGANWFFGHVLFDIPNKKLQVIDSVGGGTDAGLMAIDPDHWHNFKAVFDFPNRQVKCYLDSTEYPTLPTFYDSTISGNGMYIDLLASVPPADILDIQIDDFILTIDEP